MATITFTDGTGAVTFSNDKAGPGSRFSMWTPDIVRVADRRTALGTGVSYEYLFREDFVASFTIEHIPLSQLENAVRFKRWALQGNTFSVNTQDKQSRTYTCRLMEGAQLELAITDRTFVEYSLDIVVSSASSPKVFLKCEYV
jgi:hypothetical protein